MLDSIFLQLPMRKTHIIAIDGRYKGYPDKSPLSTDGSRDIIRAYQDKYGESKISLHDYPNLLERRKRQKYIDISESLEASFLLIVDSDDWVECRRPIDFLSDLRRFEKEWKFSNETVPWQLPRIGNIINVPLSNNGSPNLVDIPRLWYRPQDMEYTGRHYWFKRKDQDIPAKGMNFEQAFQYKALRCESIIMKHDHYCKSAERNEKRKIYEDDILPTLEE